MKREHFVKVVEEVLDSLPQEFRSRIRNVAVLVEDMPPNQPSPQSGQQRRLLLGLFHGVPTTKKSIFDLPMGPDHIVLYQKNIEAVCSTEAEVRQQIRLTVIHELGHYFGLDGEQLKVVWGGPRIAMQNWGSRKRGFFPDHEPICPFLLYQHGWGLKLDLLAGSLCL